MSERKRNISILLLVGLLLAASAFAILRKPTNLGLDLEGGVELVYQALPSAKIPEVTPQNLDDAINTIRKRTDALGVSEPEIQRAGAKQISIGLPNVKDPRRAIEQVGSTAQLQFYDWEANVFGDPDQALPTYFEAVKTATEVQPRAEAVDIPPEGASGASKQQYPDKKDLQAYYDRQNNTTPDRYYLFNADKEIVLEESRSCKALATDFEELAARGETSAGEGEIDDQQPCAAELRALEQSPGKNWQVFLVKAGVVILQAEQPEQLKNSAIRYERFYVLEDDAELLGSDLKNPTQQNDPQLGQPVVTFELTKDGQAAFQRVTRRLAERGQAIILPPGTADKSATFQRFAIALDNEIVSRAVIDWQELPDGIDGKTGAQISGLTNLQEAQDLANNLRIGALPIELKLVSQTQVSATLGKQALNQGLLAAGIGLLLTLTFLVAFYRGLGLVAGAALVAYAVFLYALVKLIPITLTLPGIAGLILTLGVAADANIVIFERIKEEVRTGASIPRAISAGYAKALKTIIDANVVTLGVAFILFMLATAGIKGFAFTLLIGTLVSLFTAVLATSAMLGVLGRTRLLGTPKAMRATGEGHRWKFDFTGRAKWFFSFSGVVLIAGALAIAGLGIQFGIDFESGTRIKTPLNQDATAEQVRSTIAPLGYADAEIQTATEEGVKLIQISTQELQPDQVQRVKNALDEEFGVDSAQFNTTSVGPTFGAQIAKTALIAVFASLLLVSIYIGFRFEFKFAVPVLIALVHDLLITAGVYALADREVNAATVAALLTILGYSLYDTIIVFDRIRENTPRMPRATFGQIVNRSMSEVLTRSLVTSFSTLVPVVALMLFGGETLRDFAFALLVGVASGTYSSIFIATPVLAATKERERIYKRRHANQLVEWGEVPAYFREEDHPPGTAIGREQQTPAAGTDAWATTPPTKGATAPAEQETGATKMPRATEPVASNEIKAPEAQEKTSSNRKAKSKKRKGHGRR